MKKKWWEEKGVLELRTGVMEYVKHREQITLGAWEHPAIYIVMGTLHGHSWVPSGLCTHWIACHPKYPFLKDVQPSPSHLHVALSSLMRFMSRAKEIILTFQLCVSLYKAFYSHSRASRLPGWSRNPSSWLMLLLLSRLRQMLIYLT